MAVKISHLWEKSPTGPYWFKRAVPKDLVQAVGKTWIQFSLGTRDIKIAARLIDQHAQEQDRQWSELRNPTKAGTLELGRQLLRDVGIDPEAPKDSPDHAQFVFEDLLDSVLPDHIREQAQAGEVSRSELDRYLSPIHKAALDLYQGRVEHLASDCRDEYLATQSDTAKSATLPFQYLLDLFGDRPLGKYRRSDVRNFVQHLCEGSHSPKGKPIATTTVGRYITTLKAAWARSIREHELTVPGGAAPLPNVWAGTIEYPKDAKGAQKRLIFVKTDYRRLFTAIGDISQADDIRCALVLLAETGARLAEVIGLRVCDCHPDASVPYIRLEEHDSRSIKTGEKGERDVPLTPRALEALRRTLVLASNSAYVFSRYTSDKGCKATHASNTLSKWLRSQGITPTCHGMRHGMKDLLRAAGCPSDIQDQILGHQTPGVGARYGQGYPLSVLRDWLSKALALLQ